MSMENLKFEMDVQTSHNLIDKIIEIFIIPNLFVIHVWIEKKIWKKWPERDLNPPRENTKKRLLAM